MRPHLVSFPHLTRTLQRACGRPPPFVTVHQAAFASGRGRPTRTPSAGKGDGSIPFEWDNENDARDHESAEGEKEVSTITPSEESVFQRIFKEITQGQMPTPKRPSGSNEGARSRGPSMPAMGGFGAEPGRFLDNERYPPSLKPAAMMALNKFKLAPDRPRLSGMPGLAEAEARQMAEWQKNHEIQTKEKERVVALMNQCRSDLDLWQVMEKEVFSLPEKLGIVERTPETPAKRKRKNKKQPTKAKEIPNDTVLNEIPLAGGERSMDIHGPLYPHYLAIGIELFDTAFSKSSPLAFNIIPRMKMIGLPSYVLGVSTSLFNKLAQIHWNQFGDLVSTLNTLEEMREVVWADYDTEDLLKRLRNELHGCTWGAQGPFVMAMTQLPPYNGNQAGRIEALENYTAQSIREQRLSKTPGEVVEVIEDEDDEDDEILNPRGIRGNNNSHGSRDRGDSHDSHDAPDDYDYNRGTRNKFQYEHRGL
ncbi:hypothetical protein B0T10DRAFT_491126 [Thelonectria olida]|uniref:Mtf2-like C-terminal domain-containing protein n=1 Tax=Thelonectria olida TaxID=1576542 RepID=A0A9P8W377_9HYPO|nr:hypothetical protein B0T10DRAFT_491126 [Thelonectria olida]